MLPQLLPKSNYHLAATEAPKSPGFDPEVSVVLVLKYSSISSNKDKRYLPKNHPSRYLRHLQTLTPFDGSALVSASNGSFAYPATFPATFATAKRARREWVVVDVSVPDEDGAL